MGLHPQQPRRQPTVSGELWSEGGALRGGNAPTPPMSTRPDGRQGNLGEELCGERLRPTKHKKRRPLWSGEVDKDVPCIFLY